MTEIRSFNELLEIAKERAIEGIIYTRVEPEEFIDMLNSKRSYDQILNRYNDFHGIYHHWLKCKGFCFSTRTKYALCDFEVEW